MKQLTLYHNNRSLKTLSDYMDANRITGISVDDLFDFKYNDTKRNRDLFFEQMSVDEKSAYSKSLGKSKEDAPLAASDLKSDMTLPCPCVFKIEAKYVTRELAISQTNFQQNTDDIFAFENSLIQRILNNDGYTINAQTNKANPNCSVWGWFKSLYYSGSTLWDSEFQSKNNKFIDISDFIVNVSTSVSAQGGTFTLTLPIIHSLPKEEIRNRSIKRTIRTTRGETSIDVNDFYTDRFSEKGDLFLYNRYPHSDKKKNFFHKIGLSEMGKNYFNWLIQSNDLIFISFEELEMEQNTGSRVFDMIGLVENVSVSQDANGGGRVVVSGKDLMKLITDDNSLFFNTSSAWSESRIFSNSESLGKQGDIRDADLVGGVQQGPENRLRRSTNQIDVFAAPFNRTINFVLKGVISQLANIEVVPDYVFNAWGDFRTKYSDWLSYEEQESAVMLNEGEYGDAETYSNPEFLTGVQFNENKGKDKDVDAFYRERKINEEIGVGNVIVALPPLG